MPFLAIPDSSDTLPADGSESHWLLPGCCKFFFPYRLLPDSPGIALSVLFCPDSRSVPSVYAAVPALRSAISFRILLLHRRLPHKPPLFCYRAAFYKLSIPPDIAGSSARKVCVPDPVVSDIRFPTSPEYVPTPVSPTMRSESPKSQESPDIPPVICPYVPAVVQFRCSTLL